MADREKVIKELKERISHYQNLKYIGTLIVAVPLELLQKSLSILEKDSVEYALYVLKRNLKEQEAVEPKITTLPKKDHDDSHIYRCGNCDMIIFKSHKYCPFCGKAVKWNGTD